jgi:mRNA-degrading endonuclease YafQ of YafQ-DinJ toxin-antitoxin module
VKYTFKATKTFWKNLAGLDSYQQEASLEAWAIFKNDPFDRRLRPHQIQKLSALAGHKILSVDVAANLRVIFRQDGDVITTLDIGTHDIYK